jgi:PilZ domain-containing protein
MKALRESDRSERREWPRFRIVLPVTTENGTGWTRDVSAGGVYVKLFDRPQRLPQPGSHIVMELVLEHIDPEGPFTVACEGEVLRVEQAPAHLGVALRISSYQLDAGTRRSGEGQRPTGDAEGEWTAIAGPTGDGRWQKKIVRLQRLPATPAPRARAGGMRFTGQTSAKGR